MTKRPDTLETVRMALELLRRIPRGRKVSAAELHHQLTSMGIARDLRTIQRLLESLSEYFEIERDDRNKPYGYQWKERSKGIGLPILSEQESLLLTLAEQQLRYLLPDSLMKSMDGFFIQARSNLNHQPNAQLQKEWVSKVRVVSTTQPLLPPKINANVFEVVSNALFRNQWLTLEYKNSSGKKSNVEVMPLGLAQQGPRMYLVCRYRNFNNERSLAIHRIMTAKASTLTFERPKEFNLQKYDDEGRFGFGEGKRIKLSFQIEKDAGLHLLESPLSNDQEVKEFEDHFYISATVVDTAQLQWWLRSFGDLIQDVQTVEVDNLSIIVKLS